MRFFCVIMLLHAPVARAADYYAASTATAGAGTLADPWVLHIALTNALITAGDTLYLRGGTYSGNWYSRINANAAGRVTVKPYLAESVLVTDGAFGELRTTMDTMTTAIVIKDSLSWQVTQVAMIADENVQLQARSSPTNWTVVRGWNGTTAAAHSIGDRVIVQAPLIYHIGTNVTWYGLQLTSVQSTNRTISPGGTNNWWVSPGLDMPAPGKGNSVVNCQIYNVGHPGIGFWLQGTGSEITGCLIYGVGFFDWNGATWTRGSGIYAQSESGFATVSKNVSFRNFTSGMKVYGETGPVKEYIYTNNIVFDVFPTIEASSGSTSTSNILIDANWMMGIPDLSYTSFTNRLTHFVNNVVVNGHFEIGEFQTLTITNNTVLMPNAGAGGSKVFYESTKFGSNDLSGVVWDRNTYYQRTGANAFNWDITLLDMASVNSSGGGILRFTNDVGKSFQDWSRWDSNSVWAAEWPTNYQLVEARAMNQDGARVHVVCVNADTNTTNATLSLSAFGYIAGQQYILRDAQNYFNPITTGTWNGVAINLPLNRTNVSDIPGSYSTVMTNEHTNVDYPGLFNAFVLERQGESVAGSVAARLGAGRNHGTIKGAF